ncbi:tetratricopeptide repeat protein [Candidatus Moduliflexota bacterium]
MRPLHLVVTVLFLIPAPAGLLSAGEGPPIASDPYLTDWQVGGRNMEEARYREAIDSYQRYIDDVPKAVGARIMMGYAYEQIGQKEKARQLFDDAASIYPDFAMDYFREEPGPHPGIADAMCGVGMSYVERGKILEALEVFEDALRVYPDHVDAHFRLGVAYLNLGERGYALEAYDSLKRLDGEKASDLLMMIARSSPPVTASP